MFKIGSYVCENVLIGKGSFAAVYKGKNIDNDKAVAIKIIDIDRLVKTGSDKKKVDINREIDVMKGMKHPNIVELYDVYKGKDRLEGSNNNSVNPDDIYLCLEYCDHGDLHKYLSKCPGKKLSEQKVRYFMIQLASGLKYIRSKQILHRDLKPHNLLLSKASPDSNDLILKIADFGFAKFMENQSLTDTICGSPLYMAPELFKLQKYTVKSDLWSVGVIMYEMLTGTPLFNCRTQFELIKLMEKFKLTIPSSLDKNVSKPCLHLLMSLLRKEVNERITWDEFFLHPWLGLLEQLTSTNGLSISSQIKPISSQPRPISKRVPIAPNQFKAQSYTPPTYVTFSPSTSPYSVTSPSQYPSIKYNSLMEQYSEKNNIRISCSPNDKSSDKSSDSSRNCHFDLDDFEKDCVMIDKNLTHSSNESNLHQSLQFPYLSQSPQSNQSPQFNQSPQQAVIYGSPGSGIAGQMLINDFNKDPNKNYKNIMVIAEIADSHANINDHIAALSIYIKVLNAIKNIIRQLELIKSNNSNIISWRDNLIKKIILEYDNITDKADKSKTKILTYDNIDINTQIDTPEKILYQYALNIGKEASINEEFYNKYSKSRDMLKISLSVFERLLFDCCDAEDKKVIYDHILIYSRRIDEIIKKENLHK